MNKKPDKKNDKTHRRYAAILAAVAAIALTVSGTYAWMSISQQAANNREGDQEETGARLHDDFDEDQNFITGGNKDVYVENYSGQNPEAPDQNGRPVYVRVRITEYMEIGEGAGNYLVDSIVDPVDYQYLDEVGTGRTIDPDNPNNATPVITGTPSDPTGTPSILNLGTWQIHTPDPTVGSDNSEIHDYWEWQMGGSKIYMPTFNKDNESLLTDRTTDAHDTWNTGDTKGPQTAAYATGINQTETHQAKSTLETADVVTMDEWVTLGRPLDDPDGNGYWVGDYDGWFYWSKALMPTDATGLLLNGITMVEEPQEEAYYGIHVTSQMASGGDWGDEGARTGFYTDGLSADAKALLNQAAELTPSIRSIQITAGNRAFVKAGESLTLSADLKLHHPSGDPGEQVVTWSIDDPAGNLSSQGKLTTQTGDAGKVYIITATTQSLPNPMTDTITVVVYDPAAAGVVGPQDDRNYYLDLGDNTFQKINPDGSVDPALRCGGTDKIVGNNNDILDVIVNPDGTKMLDNKDGTYSTPGPDQKLGTDDDIQVTA